MTTQQRHGLLVEGALTGFIGATAVALWFLVVDMVHGHPLRTPAILGNALFSIPGPTTGESTALHVFGYTIFHYFAFIVVGTIAAAIMRRADDEPSVMAGALIFFFVIGLGVVAGAELNAALVEPGGKALRGEHYEGPYEAELPVEEPAPEEEMVRAEVRMKKGV